MQIKYFLIILITIVIFLGCGGGGGSGVGHVIVTGQISGNISLDETLASERAIIASNTESFRASGFNQAVVFLEELPSRAVYPDSNGNYCFTDLPLDTAFHVIVRINSLTSKVYKSRSSAVLVESSRPEVVKNFHVSSADEAKYQIRLQVNDTKDSPVSKCNVWLWGEEFTVDEGGCYLSPMMPLGATGKMKIVPPSNKELVTLECDIDSSTFQSEIKGVSSVTLPPYGITQKRAPYVSLRVGELLPGGSAVRIYGTALDPQNDYLDYEWTTNVSSFTYTSFDKSYVEWAIPSEPTTAVIKFKANQVSSTLYPLLYSYAELYIKISKDGTVTFPGEIVIVPTQRSIQIISSATTQITGNTIAYYEAVASFPNDLEINYGWECSEGAIESGNNSRRAFWHSPALKAYESKIATLTCYASDGIATVSKDLSISVTSFPTVNIAYPVESEFYPGEITFNGMARDYLGNIIDGSVFEWYVATSTSNYQFVESGNASFTYNFTQKGPYSVALNAPDSAGIVGSATKEITILNCSPVISILSPENDAGYLKNDTVIFSADITDYEDGKITEPERITWNSDIDSVIGSGTYFEVASLSKGMHTITVTAVDEDGGTASVSVVIWYDMPARITLSPESGSVFFDQEFMLTAKGVDEGNKPLDISTYKWYLDGADWAKDGLESFTTTGLAAGFHTIKVVGRNKAVDVVSDNYCYEVGYPAPVISSPASGTRFDIGSSISFVATPPATGSLTFNWYLDGSTSSLGSSTSLITTLEKGRHKIEYVGVDTAGKTLCGSTTVVVENVPVVTIDNVATGSKFFITHDIEFKAIADVSDSNVAWYLDGSDIPFKTGKNIALTQEGMNKDIEAGYHTISVVATGEYGTTASASVGFTSGIEAVGLNKPVGTTFAENENIEFEAKPVVDGLPLQWYLNGSPWKTAASFNYSFSESSAYSIRVIATDSANVASYKDITLNVGLFPIMNLVFVDANGAEVDPDNKVFFAGNTITVRGSGINPIDGNVISGSNMSWYIYNNSDNPVKVSEDGQNNSQITIPASAISLLGEGIRKIELRGKASSSSDAYGSKTKQAYFNLPALNYTEPADNQIIHLDATKQYSQVFVASGTPNAVSPLKFEWWLNWGTSDAQKLSDVNTGIDYGSRMELQIASGIQYLTFVGTDSAGFVSLKTKKLTISDNAAIEFTPDDGSVIFAKQPFDLEVNNTVVKESLEWLLKYNGGTEIILSPRGSPYTVDHSRQDTYFASIGYYEITASGVNSLNVPASITNKIYYGLADAKISSPASGTRFQLNSIQNFIATPTADSAYAIRAQNSSWYLDDIKLGEFDNLCDINTTIEGGYHILRYSAIDSIGNETSDEIGILFDDAPVIGLAEPVNQDNDIYIFAHDTAFTFNGSGTVMVKPNEYSPSNYKWYVNNDFSAYDSGPSVAGSSLNFIDGENTLIVTAEDQYAVVGTHSRTVFFNEPIAQILQPADRQIVFNTDVVCEGSNSPRINMDWYLNGVKIGNGANCTISDSDLPLGENTITYIGTDSFGLESIASVLIIKEDKPTMQIKTNRNVVADNAVFFPITSGNLRFVGSGVNGLNGDAIDSSKLVWNLYSGSDTNSEPIANYTGTTFDVTYSKFNTNGYYTLELTGEDGYGNKGTKTSTFYYGYSAPEITVPGSVATFSISAGTGTGINLAAYSDPNLTTEFPENWVASWTSKSFTNELAYMGSGKSLSGITFATASRYLVTYTEIDSNGVSKSATSDILIDDDPIVNINTNLNIAANGAGFYKIDSGNMILKSDVESDCPPMTYSWKLYAGSDTTTASFDNATTQNYSIASSKLNSNIGNCTAQLTVTDRYGASSDSTATFYYGLQPPDISSPSAYIDIPIAAGAAGIKLVGTVDSRLAASAKWFDGATDITGSINNLVLSPGIHQITFIATDSNDIEKHDTVQIDVNDKPFVSIKNKNTGTPIQGSFYFTLANDSESIQFTGYGKDAITNADIGADKMKWTLYSGEGAVGTGNALSGNSDGTLTLTRSRFSSAATYTIKLQVEDSLGFTNESIQSFYYGHALPTITSPANGSKMKEDSVWVTFTAGTENPSFTTKTWKYCSGGIATHSVTANPMEFGNGTYTVSLSAVDSAGIEKVAVSSFAVNKDPIVAISSPTNGDYYFGNKTLTLTGTAKKSNGTNLPDEKITWYRSSSPTGTETKLGNGSNITVTPETIGTGTWYIRLVGIDSDYPPDQVSSASIRITTGIVPPTITSPASGTRFDTGTSVLCEGNDLSSYGITLTWTYDDNPTMASGKSASLSGLPRGFRTIKYSGKDSANEVYTATAMVLMDKIPTITQTPQIVTPSPLGDGLQNSYGNYYKIVLASEGTQLNFQVEARDEENTAIASVTWIDTSTKSIVDGSNINPRNFVINPSGPGSYTYYVLADDIYGVRTCATYSFWIWDCETYTSGITKPKAMTNNGDGNLYFAGSTNGNQITKMVRITTASPSNTSGDITYASATAIASCTVGEYLSLAISSSNLYSFSGDNAGNFSLQNWDANNLVWTNSHTDQTSFGGGLVKIPNDGFAMGGGYYYVSDQTNNRFVKLSNDGSYINSCSIAMNNIGAVKYVDDNSIFVAVTGDNKVYKLKSNNNTDANWISDDLPSGAAPSGLVYSSNTKRLYVVSAANKKIYVLDGQTGRLLYSFGKSGSTPHQGQFTSPCAAAICGSNGTSDLYISDTDGNCIVRFRSGVSW